MFLQMLCLHWSVVHWIRVIFLISPWITAPVASAPGFAQLCSWRAAVTSSIHTWSDCFSQICIVRASCVFIFALFITTFSVTIHLQLRHLLSLVTAEFCVRASQMKVLTCIFLHESSDVACVGSYLTFLLNSPAGGLNLSQRPFPGSSHTNPEPLKYTQPHVHSHQLLAAA